jgi:hypothetical protein
MLSVLMTIGLIAFVVISMIGLFYMARDLPLLTALWCLLMSLVE